MTHPALPDPADIRARLTSRARALGFASIGVSGIELGEDERRLDDWLAAGWHGEMQYMARHGTKRSRPAQLLPGTLRVISARMDYWPEAARPAGEVLGDSSLGYVSRYALGRDYHRLMRKALQQLADHLAALLRPHGHRVFSDSAPVLEKALARNAGLGWIGKHTNLIARDAGSYFFLGEIYTDLELPIDEPASAHCGSCTACMPACPTGAIVAPWKLDARRCISYLTIELHGPIPEDLRPAMGNRIYGCDDCQLVCPWNRYARAAANPDFKVRHGLDAPRLAALFAWTEAQFTTRMSGSAIHRLGIRALAAQHRGRARQCADDRRSARGAGGAARRRLAAGARARAVGAGAPRIRGSVALGRLRALPKVFGYRNNSLRPHIPEYAFQRPGNL